jgi:hypothetical protein
LATCGGVQGPERPINAPWAGLLTMSLDGSVTMLVPCRRVDPVHIAIGSRIGPRPFGRIRCERRLGELIAAMPKAPAGRPVVAHDLIPNATRALDPRGKD